MKKGLLGPAVLGALGFGALMVMGNKQAAGAPVAPPLVGGGSGGGGGPGGGASDNWPLAGVDSPGAGDGLQLASALPPGPTNDRDAAIYDLIRTGYARTSWAPVSIQTQDGSITATIFIMARTLRVGASNSVRVGVGYGTQQQLCDMMGGCMFTSRIADIRRQQSPADLALEPQTEPWFADGSMGNTDRMIQYNQHLDGLVADDTGQQLVSNEGKLWIIDKSLWNNQSTPFACNYGWWTSQAPTSQGPYRLFYPARPSDRAIWQQPGTVHNFVHRDYSQQIDMVSKSVVLSGALNGSCHIANILRDPQLSALITDGGPLPSWKSWAFGDKEVSDEWQAFLDQGLPTS